MNGEQSIPSFLPGFLKLFSGLAVVQLLNFGFSLVLPRFYSPEDYAFFGVFTAVVFILLEIITLKLEVTIFFPKEDQKAVEIVHAVFLICIFLSLLTLFFCLAVSFYNPWYLLLPLNLLIYGWVLPLSAWFNRIQDYKRLNTSRIIQALAIPIFSLAFIIFFDWHFGLVLGFILGQLAGLIYLFFCFKEFNLGLLQFSLMKKYLREYRHFPKFGVLSSLVGSLSRNSIVIFIEYFFGVRNAGYYTLGNKILTAPAGMYQSSLSQVFLQQGNKMSNVQLRAYIRKMVWFGFVLGIIPAIIILVFGKEIFAFAFGVDWTMAGKIAQYLILWIFSMAIISPVGLLLDIKQKLKFELGWNTILLALRITVILLCVWLSNFYLMLGMLCGVGVLMNVVLLVYILKLTDEK